MTSLNPVRLATVSVGFVTVAYYILLSVTRYFVRKFSRRLERTTTREDTPPESPVFREDCRSIRKLSEMNVNGVVPHSVGLNSGTRNGLKPENALVAGLIKSGRNGVNPRDFERFVGHSIILKFERQRQIKFQFFVVVLASEDDLSNLQNITFHPHKPSSPRQPLIDNHELIMPKESDYGNYIVARFESSEYHSEEVVFGPKYNNPFSQLWSAYVRKNDGNQPKAIILYSWNFPCARCTKLIVNVLSQQQYSGTHVMLTYSQIWDSEEGYPDVSKRNMEVWREQIGAHIQEVEPPLPLQEAGPSSALPT